MAKLPDDIYSQILDLILENYTQPKPKDDQIEIYKNAARNIIDNNSIEGLIEYLSIFRDYQKNNCSFTESGEKKKDEINFKYDSLISKLTDILQNSKPQPGMYE